MLLKNVSARLITINGKNTVYPIKPGDNPSVEVPDEIAGIDFVKALIENGSLKVEKSTKKADDKKADETEVKPVETKEETKPAGK